MTPKQVETLNALKALGRSKFHDVEAILAARLKISKISPNHDSRNKLRGTTRVLCEQLTWKKYAAEGKTKALKNCYKISADGAKRWQRSG